MLSEGKACLRLGYFITKKKKKEKDEQEEAHYFKHQPYFRR